MKATGKERNKYLNLNRWLSGELKFWTRPNPETPSTGYNVQAYESILQGWVQREKKLSNLGK